LAVLFTGCSSNRIVTGWKTQHIYPTNYNRILVVAILPDEDSAQRDNIEKSFTVALKDLGYPAVAATTEFGRTGLANLGQDETYKKLYHNGIDAVITVALVNRSKETEHLPASSYTYRNNFYYTRIFEYKSTLTQPGNNNKDEQYFWESILFDVSKLEATTAVQTTPSSKPDQLKMSNDIARRLIQKMKREKTLKKQKPVQKAF
jgi:hypothetical protein